MQAQKTGFEVFVHGARADGSRPQAVVVNAEASDTLGDVIARAGVTVPSGGVVFVGECTTAIGPGVDAGPSEDCHDPVDPATTLTMAGVGKGGHVHAHTCRRIAVTVNYRTATKHRRFSPATRIETVTEWARRAFHLTDSDSRNLVLQICGTDERPRPTQHLGEVVATGSCEVCFDLVPELKVEG